MANTKKRIISTVPAALMFGSTSTFFTYETKIQSKEKSKQTTTVKNTAGKKKGWFALFASVIVLSYIFYKKNLNSKNSTVPANTLKDKNVKVAVTDTKTKGASLVISDDKDNQKRPWPTLECLLEGLKNSDGCIVVYSNKATNVYYLPI